MELRVDMKTHELALCGMIAVGEHFGSRRGTYADKETLVMQTPKWLSEEMFFPLVQIFLDGYMARVVDEMKKQLNN